MTRRPGATLLESAIAVVLLVVVLALGLALWRHGPAGDEEGPGAEEAVPAAGKDYRDQLLEIARTYEDYGRVDDRSRWVPTLCRLIPGRARFSASGDEAMHGLKLYSVFARDYFSYMMMAEQPQPIGQVVVKEAWLPEEVKEEPKEEVIDGNFANPFSDGEPAPKKQPRVQSRIQTRWRPAPEGDPRKEVQDSFNPYAEKDGKLYRAARPAGLFLMLKTEPGTPGTDEGWVYATIAADHKEVTAAGRLESCMGCHQQAPHDRLFGLPKPKS